MIVDAFKQHIIRKDREKFLPGIPSSNDHLPMPLGLTVSISSKQDLDKTSFKSVTGWFSSGEDNAIDRARPFPLCSFFEPADLRS